MPNVGDVAFWIVKVAAAETSTVPVTVKLDGIVKFVAFVPLPTTILEPLPDTVQVAPIVGKGLLRMLKSWLAVVKFEGEVPVPSVFVPQFETTSRLPVDLE